MIPRRALHSGAALAAIIGVAPLWAASSASGKTIDAGLVERSELVQTSRLAGSAGGVIGGFAGGRTRCPAGKSALTGGAFWRAAGQGPDPAGEGLSVSGSAVSSNLRGWYAQGGDFNLGDLLTTYARCVREAKLREAKTVVRRIRPPDSVFAEGRAKCRPGARLVSGGAYFHPAGDSPDPAGSARMAASVPLPSGRGWYAKGKANFENSRLSVVAVCVPERQLANVKRVTGTSSLPADGLAGVGGYLSCPSSRRALTGGAYVHAPGESFDGANYAAISMVSGSSITGDTLGWYATGSRFATGAVPPLDLTIVVHCLAR